MIGILGVDIITPRWLHPDDDIAEMQDREGEIPAINFASGIKRIRLRLTPTLLDAAAGIGWQLTIADLVVGHTQALAALLGGAIGKPVRRSRQDPLHQISTVGRQVSRGVTGHIKCP